MVFGTVIIAMLLSAPNARCESPAEMVTVSQDYGPLIYAIQFDPALPIDETKYYHLIGATDEKLVLMGITNRMPTVKDLRALLYRYVIIITDGGL